MLDLYGSRDGEVRTEGKVGGEENDIKASNLSDEEDCYNFMRSVVKSRALCKDDTHAENIESKNISESGGVGDVSMNDIGTDKHSMLLHCLHHTYSNQSEVVVNIV